MLGVATSAGVARLLVGLGIVSIERQAAVEGTLWLVFLYINTTQYDLHV